MRKLRFLTVAVLLLSVSPVWAQTPRATPAPQTAAAGTVKLSGKVVDSTGGVMVAVDVKVFEGERAVATTQTDANGAFSVNVPPGPYRVEVTAVDFSPAKPTVQATADMQPLAITLTLAALAETRVEVNTQSAQVGVDPESSLTAQTLTGDALLDLPENEDDLATYLQNLAARVGGAEGAANVVIDGFTEGRLPARDQIAEIRIVNNTFSAEGAGGGPRIEIITRTGTGKWTGNFGFGFSDESLNAAIASSGKRPQRQTRNYTTQASGPVIRNKLNMGFNIRSNESEGSAQSVRAVGPDGPVNFVLSSPTVQRTYGIQNARYNFTPSNTLNFSGNITRITANNQGVGGFNLQSRASNRKDRNWQVQMSDRATLSSALVHELRFQASRNNQATIPVSSDLAINVADAFTSGGGATRNDNHSQNYQLANTLTWQLFQGRLNFRSGAQADYRKLDNLSQQNYNGTYFFSSLDDYCWATGFIGSNCQSTRVLVEDALAAGLTPARNNSQDIPVTITGIPTRYTRTFGDPKIVVSQAEFSGFVQGDYRLSPRAQLQMGVRYQAQQHLKDYNNFAPTVGVNYQLRNSTNWRSVVRVGGRVTQQTFSLQSWQQLRQSSGTSQQFNIDVLNPVFDLVNGPVIDDSMAQGVTNSIRTRSDDYRAGYGINTSATWEQGLPKQMSVTFTFDRTRGVHNNRNRNVNAPFPGTRLPDDVLALINSNNPNLVTRAEERARGKALVDLARPFYPIIGNITQMEPTGNSVNKNITVNFRTQNRNYFGGRVNFGGNVSYNYSWGYDDNSFVNPYDIAADWALGNRQHRVNSNAQVNFYSNHKWKNLRLNLTPTWNGGRPYTITLGRDENGDSNINDRPLGIGRNTEVGPSQFNINLTASKTFYIRSGQSTPRPSNYAEPQGGGGFGGGGGGGGFGGGGFGGGGRGNNQINTGTQMTLSANITNVLNHTQYQNYSGVLTSSFFGRPNTSSNERRITLQLTLSYR